MTCPVVEIIGHRLRSKSGTDPKLCTLSVTVEEGGIVLRGIDESGVSSIAMVIDRETCRELETGLAKARNAGV